MTRIATETLTMPQTKTTINLLQPSTTLRGNLEAGTLFVYHNRTDEVYMALTTLSLVRPNVPVDICVAGTNRGDWAEAMVAQRVTVMDAAFTRSEA